LIKKKFKVKFCIFIFFEFIIMIFCLNHCKNPYQYEGSLELKKYDWLKNRKIFIDPGHGGKGKADKFRIGHNGITEEEVNLRVALFLEKMLEEAGVKVFLSRNKDTDIPLVDRVAMVKEIKPDLLISLHHNGSARRIDEVNYPTVLIWGNRFVRPLSFNFAMFLIKEFHKIIPEKGEILSDFTIYSETGTMILRETRYICPGVIGEPGFFSSKSHSMRLMDIHYNRLEAEAYFNAIAEFFKRGIPTAEVYISSPIDKSGYLYNLIEDNSPIIAIKTDSGIKDIGIDNKSLKVTLNGIKIKYRVISDNLFILKYGKRLYPGGHKIRFSFKNLRNQSSMIYTTAFTLKIEKGDYDKLISKGIKYIKHWKTAREGLKRLLSALSLGVTDPEISKVIWYIAKGFSRIGDKANSEYYYSKLYHCYPESSYIKKLGNRVKGYRYMVEYHGKAIEIQYDSTLKQYKK